MAYEYTVNRQFLEKVTSAAIAIYNMLGSAIQEQQIETPQERTKKIFNKMDTNNDGVLSKEEFVQGCMNDRCLYQMLTADGEGPKE